MANAVPRTEKEMHGGDGDKRLVIPETPYPISTSSSPSIPGQDTEASHSGHQQTLDDKSPHRINAAAAAAAAVISCSCSSSPSCSSPPRHVQCHDSGEPQTGVTGTLITTLPQEQDQPNRKGPSVINKQQHHHHCNHTACISTQQQQQYPQHTDISEAAGQAQEIQVSSRQSCHSPEPCPSQHKQDIIPPLPAQTRLTPHQQLGLQQQLPTPPPPGYIYSTPTRERGEQAGGDHAQAHDKPHDTSGIEPQTSITAPNMIFSDLYKSPRSPFHKIRQSIPNVTLPATDLEADLISRDKARQKEAVRRYLDDKVRCDWEFTWPPVSITAPDTRAPAQTEEQSKASLAALEDGTSTAKLADESLGPGSTSSDTHPTLHENTPRDPGEEADSESDDDVSVYSTVSEDQLNFHPRVEWTSDISDDDLPATSHHSPFRFDTPDAIGTAVQTSMMEKKARRRRAVREEVAWNTGLACFEARRDAWTGAKTVRVKPKPATPISPSTRRLSFWRHHRSESTASQNSSAFSPGSPPVISSPLSPTTTRLSSEPDNSSSKNSSTIGAAIHSTSSKDSSHAQYPVETLIPVPPPLLPPQNPMRASVTPSIYPSLYDKIVIHSLQPSCPVNLGDMLRACVVGWKRDGEWPPRSTIQVVPMPTAAELAAHRQQRKAVQQQQKQQRQREHARKASTATNGSSRRLSFVGFFGGGAGNKGAGAEATDNNNKSPTATTHDHEEKDGAAGAKDTHSDEGSTGKGIRKSLQKVFSLGHGHGHNHAHAHTGTVAPAAESSMSPAKEVTAAG